MMIHRIGLLGIAVLLAAPAAAFALKFEVFGNQPFTKQPDWAEGVIDLVNSKNRVYAIEGGMTSYTFFFRGDAKQLNEALKTFAAVKDNVRRVILLPGTGKTQSFEGKPVEFDWQLRVPSGRYKAVAKVKHAEMTAYISGIQPRSIDPKPVEKLLVDLNSETFKVRDAAKLALEKLGVDAKPFLRKALQADLPEESRRRIEGVLARLRDLDLTDLEVPPGITIITADDLLSEGYLQLKDPDPGIFGRPMNPELLGGLVSHSDQVLPSLHAMLEKKNGSYLRCLSAAWLGQLGDKAKITLPQLQQGREDPDPNVGKAFQAAVTQIESSQDRPEVVEEQIRKHAAIFREIQSYKETGGKK